MSTISSQCQGPPRTNDSSDFTLFSLRLLNLYPHILSPLNLRFIAKCHCRRRTTEDEYIRRRYREEINRYLHPLDGDLGWISQISPDLLRHHHAAMQNQNPQQSEEEQVASRRAFIERSLLSKKVVVAEGVPAQETTSDEEEPDIRVGPSSDDPPEHDNSDTDTLDPVTTKAPIQVLQEKSDLVIRKVEGDATAALGNGGGDDDENTCAICWMEYQEGEDICWSQNAECGHAFHRDCIQEWLIRHNDCPCCRSNYLPTQEDSSDPTVVPPISREPSDGTTQQTPNVVSLIDFLLLMQQVYYNSANGSNLFDPEATPDEAGIEIGPAIEDYGLTGPAPIVSATTIPLGMEALEVPESQDDQPSIENRIEIISEEQGLSSGPLDVEDPPEPARSED